MGIDVRLERWIRAYPFASFPSTKRKARLSALSHCCNLQEEKTCERKNVFHFILLKGNGRELNPFSFSECNVSYQL